MLTIRLFGSPEVWRERQPVRINRRKSRAVVYYLAAQIQPIQRSNLLEMFWMDLPRSHALQTLRSTLYNLRRELGEAIQIENDQIHLQPGVEVDARRFEAGLKTIPDDIQELADLIELFRGDFLEGFNAPDSQLFEDWVTIERERYRRLAIRGLSALSERYENIGDYHHALLSVDRALALDALQEDLHRERIRLLYISGDRPGAIRHYDYLRRLLDDELGIPPMKETRALYDDLINDRLKTPVRPVPKFTSAASQGKKLETTKLMPFIGRQLELEYVRKKIAPGRLLLIEGEPGIGKTRLVQEFFRKSSFLAIAAAAHEMEHRLPYHPWIEGLRGLRNLPEWPRLQTYIQANMLPVWWREVVRLVPDLSGQKLVTSQDNVEADEARLWEGIHQFLRLLANQSPLIVFLDDLQWADSASLGLLSYLVRQDDIDQIGFLATTRNVLPGSKEAGVIQTLARTNRLEQLQLGRLEKSDIIKIAQHITPEFAQPFAEWLYRNSEGNPFVLAELIRHLANAQILKGNGKIDLSALSVTPVVPKSVYLLIQSRLIRLSDQAHRLLDAAVAAGREFDIDLVARAAALSDEAALDAAKELENAGFILPQSGMHYRFDHTLTMEVAYQMIGEPRHRILHRRMAEALEAKLVSSHVDDMAAEIAMHFSEGKDLQRAAPYAYRAGMQAARLAAWHEAIDFYQQALLGFEGKDRFSVLMALGRAFMASGALAEATEIFREAYDVGTVFQDQEYIDGAALAMGEAFLPQSRYQEAIEMARQVRETGLPHNAVVAEFIWGTALSLEGAHLDEAADHLRLAQRLCCEQSDSKFDHKIYQARILFELGGIAAQRGDLAAAIELYHQVKEIACSAGGDSTIWCALAYNNLAYHLLLLGDAKAQEYAEIGLNKAQENGLFELLPYIYSTLGEIALKDAGFNSVAEDYFRQGLALAEKFNMEERIAGLTANLGRLEIVRGNIAEAKRLISFASKKAETLGTRYQWAQIQLWLAPLLSSDDRQKSLNAVKMFAEEGGRKRLLAQIREIENQV